MPHIHVKLYPGRTEEQKKELTKAIVDNVVSIAKCSADSVSVAIEEVNPEEWDEKVYGPDIMSQKENLYKKPGYNDFK